MDECPQWVESGGRGFRTGPGVAENDIASLFTLFFTRRLRGGRRVVLYLSRANLTAGGHRIRYRLEAAEHVLPGASFLIGSRGGEFNAGVTTRPSSDRSMSLPSVRP